MPIDVLLLLVLLIVCMEHKILNKNLLILALAGGCLPVSAERIACFPMDVDGGKVWETVGGNSFDVQGAREPVVVSGAVGKALRFDGYSSVIEAALPASVAGKTLKSLTFSVWCAAETYPIMAHDSESDERCVIAGNLDDAAKKGFAFCLGRDGKYSFECYSGGWKVNCRVDEPLPCYAWNNLTAVVDGAKRTIKLYLNGVEVASSRSMGGVDTGDAPFMLGRAAEPKYLGQFQINTFNGIIDEVCLYDTVVPESEIAAWKPESAAVLNYPQSRYADDLMRPRFHGMPSGNWTNECHGLVKYDGKYHLFFQKNGNGPYMSRLQWGHIVSDDLVNWEEMPIALNTDEAYDIKGCWSGCVFTDAELTGGKPNIFYTAVDYARAVIAQASPADQLLKDWNKSEKNPIVNGRPSGLSDDFRDPYLFKAEDGNYYMIVGTSKDGLGAATLHRYDKTTGTWSNDGTTFFRASGKISGRFWEMPTVNNINGKWLFTATPLETTQGVEVQYWTGTINPDGTFSTSMTTPGKVELEGMSKDGYGLLSPSIAEIGGKTVAMGIVPDKLAGDYNYQMGWAHTYSLPREWTISDDGQLLQRPYEGLTKLRTDESFQENGFRLDGNKALGGVNGRMVEVCAEFVAGGEASEYGFELLKNGSKSLRLYYSRATNKVVVDMTTLDRWVNDAGAYDGLYESSLPESVADGEIVKIHAFLDHSVLDVFINDKWAFSTRVFATDREADGVEAFSTGDVEVRSLAAWKLAADGGASVSAPRADGPKVVADGGMLTLKGLDADSIVSVYRLDGRLLRKERASGELTCRFPGEDILLINVVSEKDSFSKKLTMK